MKPSDSKKSTIIEPASAGSSMSMRELKRHYHDIVTANAIYYPVAFQFLKEHGEGRQGKVFLGLRQGARGCITEHAIKVFDPDIYRSPEEYWTDMGRIASQISKLQRVQSPSLVSRHSYEETYGIGYVQMESIDGIDIRRMLTKAHLEIAKKKSSADEWEVFMNTIFQLQDDCVSIRPGVVVYILKGILRGLETLHERNFLHADIKPGNVMIDRLGYVKVVDFGRAMMLRESPSFLLGSPMYMAPEIHEHRIGSEESDLYSVGLVGMEMLTGKQIAASTDEKELLEIKKKLPGQLHKLWPEGKTKYNPLFKLIKSLLDPDPATRCSSAKEAEAGKDGLTELSKTFVKKGQEIEYSRILSEYIGKLVDHKTSRVEIDTDEDDYSSALEVN
jgi:serine/threonine protein kinase